MVYSLEVENNYVEWSFKDVTEFVNYSKDADRRDRVMMVVNHHRQLLDYNNLTKEQMDYEWFPLGNIITVTET